MFVDGIVLLGGNMGVLTIQKGKQMEYFTRTDTGDVSMVLGIQISRNRMEGRLIIHQAHYVKSMLERCGMADKCNPVYTTGQGPELLLNQPEKKPLDVRGV